MYTTLLVAVACAILFHRAADYEKMAAWAWALASASLSGIVLLAVPSIPTLLLAQVALFIGMWVYNAHRPKRRS